MPTAPVPTQNFEPKPGERFAGRFTLQKSAGLWGLTRAWIARDEEANKEVVLAFLPELPKLVPDSLNRLRREVRRARQVVHPHIIRIHELVEAENGLALLMDPASGTTLDRLLAEHPQKAFSVADIKPWVGYLCQTLEDAHRAGLLHLDLAPDNLLVLPDGTLALLHFGIGHAIAELSGSETAAGRLPYTSPQLFDGEKPDASDDVYAAGVLLFEMLTGAPPFTGQNAIADIRKTTPPTVGARRQELGIGAVPIPKHWDRVIASCLGKHRADRPATAGQITSKLGVETPGTEIPPLAEPESAPPAAPAKSTEPPVPAAPAEPSPDPEPPEQKKPEPQPERKPEPPIERKPEPPPRREEAPKRPDPKRQTPPREDSPTPKPATPRDEKRPPQRDRQPPPRDPDPAKEPEHSKDWAPGGRDPVTREKSPQFPRTAFIREDKKEVPSKPVVPVAAIALILVLLAIAAIAYFVGSRKPSEPASGPDAPQPSVSHGTQEPDAPGTSEPTRTALENALAKFVSKQEASKLAAEAHRAVTGALAQVAVEAKSAADAHAIAEREQKERVAAAGENPSEAQMQAIEKGASELERLRQAKETAESALRALESKSNQARKLAEKAATELLAAEKERESLRSKEPATPAPTPADPATPPAQAIPPSDTLPPKGIHPKPSRPSAEATPQPAAFPDLPPIETAPAPSPSPTTPPEPSPSPSPTPAPAAPAENRKEAFENSLGMRFVPVKETLFSVHLTRVRDFEVFANDGGIRSSAWRRTGFKQGPDHPVVNVSWEEAAAFCQWLTKKEHASGLLPKDKFYRLPTDLEWSQAAGLTKEKGDSPEMRDMQVPDVYPWGKEWPPPADAGNYTGEETGSEVAIRGFNDGFPWTSPVGSFRPNAFGLYDMGGNVWQWCMDWWNEEKRSRVLRGGSWYNGALKLSLLSSCRVHLPPGSSTDNYGFRVVIATGKEKPQKEGRAGD